MILAAGFDEQTLRSTVDGLVRIVEAAGALVIFVGAVTAFARFLILGFRTRSAEAFVPVRLGLGRFLALGLEFQLASDAAKEAASTRDGGPPVIAPSPSRGRRPPAELVVATAVHDVWAGQVAQWSAEDVHQAGERPEREQGERGEAVQPNPIGASAMSSGCRERRKMPRNQMETPSR